MGDNLMLILSMFVCWHLTVRQGLEMHRAKTIFLTFLLVLCAFCAKAAPPALVAPVFLLPYNPKFLFYDYRPAINAAGTRIVFERSFPGGGTLNPGYSNIINLYLAELNSPSLDPAQLLVSGTNNGGSNRPDWCWFATNPSVDGPIVFSAGASGNVPTSALTGIYYTMAQPQAGGLFWSVTGTTAGMVYPTWFPGCAQIAVYVNNAIAHQGYTGPETQKFDLYGNMLGSLSGTKLWAGFPSVNQRNPRLLALAAQHFNASPNGYQQDNNYIYIANTVGNPPRVTPLDPRAPVNRYAAKFEGRAPTWSPDERWIAFESNRNCSASNSGFAIFLQRATGEGLARQVTDCSYNAQHAKWYRQPVNGRTLLIVSALRYPGNNSSPAMQNARGIASLDITAFVDSR